jgi:RNA polymerase sigma factor (sigma-70 family)
MTPPTGPADAPAIDDHRWFSAQVQPHEGQLRSYLQGKFPAVRDVDDVVQESYLRIWRAKASQSIHCAKGFLFQIARHVAMDVLRKQRGSPVNVVTDLSALSVFDHKPGVEEAMCTREELGLLAAAVEALPPRCREVVILRKIQRVPQKEIARLLGISEQTVQTQVFRGIKKCEHYLRQRGLKPPHS